MDCRTIGKRLFDFTDEFIDNSRASAVQRLDRLSVGYTTGSATCVSAGRR